MEAESAKTERVQLGVRMEKNLVKVLKGLGEFNDETLGELLEKIVFHSFNAIPGDEGGSCASPHSKRALRAIGALCQVYGVSTDSHAARSHDPDITRPDLA